MRVLDIDIDYFMDCPAFFVDINEKKRLEDSSYVDSVWEKDRVIRYIEENLGLSKDKKIKGRFLVNHDEALSFWQELNDCGKLSTPFEVIHVDSHSDLENYGTSYKLLLGEFLLKPVEARIEYAREHGCINATNYLLWAIGFKMLSGITYCANPKTAANDYPYIYMKDLIGPVENANSKMLQARFQLVFNPSMSIPNFDDVNFEVKRKQYNEKCIYKDEPVSFTVINSIEGVNYNGEFDYVSVAQSPNYTPQNADYILDIFKEYIDEA